MSGAVDGAAVVVAFLLYAAALVHAVRHGDSEFDGAGTGPRRRWLATLLLLGPVWSLAYFIYPARRLARPRPLPLGSKRWRVALSLSFTAYLSGMGFLGFLAVVVTNAVGATDWLPAVAAAYFVAGLASGVIALWHGPVLRLRRGRFLLAIAASATGLLWALITVDLPAWTPSGMGVHIYRAVFRVYAPPLVGAACAVFWHAHRARRSPALQRQVA